MFISQRRGTFAEEPHRISGAIKRVRDEAAGDCRAYWMQPIFQARRHAEVASATANGPKQVGLFVLAGAYRLSLGAELQHRDRGATLGGGLGWLMGKHGLALDNLTPPVTARPYRCISRLSSAQVTPPWARTVRFSGSTRISFIGARSIITPPSMVARPATL
jgi:hypothetical protein